MVTSMVSCTENARVRRFGGEAIVQLQSGQKLVEVTWKDNDLWYLTRPMRSNEKPEEYKFSEKSSIGIMEGVYIIKEKK